MDRGIDTNVAKRRSYRFWEGGNPDEVRKVYKVKYGLDRRGSPNGLFSEPMVSGSAYEE